MDEIRPFKSAEEAAEAWGATLAATEPGAVDVRGDRVWQTVGPLNIGWILVECDCGNTKRCRGYRAELAPEYLVGIRHPGSTH